MVEFADAALMKLADYEEKDYVEVLKSIKLNQKKAAKVLEKAIESKPSATVELCGKTFDADFVLNTQYANAGLYCFDVEKVICAIENIGADNAQGEIYLTDVLERLSKTNDAVLYEVKSPESMLTYSTKAELREISCHFMRSASQFIADINGGKLDEIFESLYSEQAKSQKNRYLELINLFIKKHGDKKVVITRSPGRINLMGRHIDHRGGAVNVMATDRDVVFVSSFRDDDVVNISNVDVSFPDKTFSISKSMGNTKYSKWIDYLNDEDVVKNLNESKGCWSNYVKSA